MGRQAGGANELATRLSGSQDLFGHGVGYLRGPGASVNFVTAHDGFTLADLTAFDHKHNLANLEENRDGSDNNHSWNHGLEGALAAPILGADPDVRDITGFVEVIVPARNLVITTPTAKILPFPGSTGTFLSSRRNSSRSSVGFLHCAVRILHCGQ